MSRKTLLLIICGILIGTIGLSSTTRRSTTARNGFAIVELFTSEGCSSCPPADALLARVLNENKGRPVYILAYHVDYWDRLGWKDTFSSPIFSQRQEKYAKWLNLSSIYTPQIVVNGNREFIGSQEKTLRRAIISASAEARDQKLEISLSGQDGKSPALDYQTARPAVGDKLVVAVITPNAQHKIGRGENRGKTLSHVQIVRSLDYFNLDGKQKGSVHLQEMQQGDAEIIAFLQNAKSGQITAATKLQLKTHG